MENSLWIIMGPALCAGLLTCLTHVPLGQEVLKRGIIFIDLAIAQIAALGVVAVNAFAGEGASPFLVYVVALLFALFAAFCFNKTEKLFPKLQEGLIGASFVVASSISLLMLAKEPHGGEATQSMLAGQILWVSWQQLAITAVIYSAILTIWLKVKSREKWFYYLFAATVTVSVQLVGVYLVFASLILPALATSNVKRRTLAGYGVSLVSLLLGVLISIKIDLPTGPTLVCTLAIVSLIYYALAKRL